MDREPHPGLLVVQSGRSPHSVSIAAALLAISVYGLVFALPSQSLGRVLDVGQLVAFAVMAVAGSSLTLIGAYWPRLLLGLLLERVGQTVLAFAAVVYIITLATTSTPGRSGLVMAIGVAVGVGSMWRSWRITRRELPAVRSWMESA